MNSFQDQEIVVKYLSVVESLGVGFQDSEQTEKGRLASGVLKTLMLIDFAQGFSETRRVNTKVDELGVINKILVKLKSSSFTKKKKFPQNQNYMLEKIEELKASISKLKYENSEESILNEKDLEFFNSNFLNRLKKMAPNDIYNCITSLLTFIPQFIENRSNKDFQAFIQAMEKATSLDIMKDSNTAIEMFAKSMKVS